MDEQEQRDEYVLRRVEDGESNYIGELWVISGKRREFAVGFASRSLDGLVKAFRDWEGRAKEGFSVTTIPATVVEGERVSYHLEDPELIKFAALFKS